MECPLGFRGEEFKNKPIRNKNRLWWPCLLMDWDRMSNIYRGPSIDASYQASVLILSQSVNKHGRQTILFSDW
jgi:hypothetical protein